MNAFKESELCIKNVFFWDSFCSCSSENEGMGRGGDQLPTVWINVLTKWSTQHWRKFVTQHLFSMKKYSNHKNFVDLQNSGGML